MKKFIEKNKWVIIITAVYLITFLLMLPLRNTAFSDDFAYTQTVEKFVKTGKLVITDWTSSSIIFPVLWGAMFSKVFGYSIKALHAANIVLFLFGLYAFYSILREFKLSEKKSTIFTVLLLAYPWIFSFLYSFMSDIFYLSTMLISISFYLKGLNRKKLKFYLLGSVFAGLAFLTRQIAVVIPSAFVLVLILRQIKDRTFRFKELLVSVAPATLAIVWFYLWTNIHGETVGYYAFFDWYPKVQVLPILFPHLQKLGPTNILYQDIFFGRPSVYLSSIMVFLIPVFLTLKVGLKDIKNFLVKNKFYLIGVVLLFAIYVYFDVLTKFVILKPPTDHLLSTDLVVKSWYPVWPVLFGISLIFWLPLMTNILSGLARKLASKSRRPLLVIVEVLALVCLLALAHYNSIRTDLPDLFSINYSSDVISFFLGIWHWQYISLTLKDSTFVLATTLAVFGIIVYLTSYMDFKKILSLNPTIVFISIILLGHIFITCVFGYTTWQEYTIPWVPLFIIVIAYQTQKVSIANGRAILVVTLAVLFSLQLVRTRYQKQGAAWEMGLTLVNQGIEPNRVASLNWSWLPYWYWETEFYKLAATEYGGNKYLVPPSRFNPVSSVLPKGDIYVVMLSDTNKVASHQGITASSYSQPYWTFYEQFPYVKMERAAIVKVEN